MPSFIQGIKDLGTSLTPSSPADFKFDITPGFSLKEEASRTFGEVKDTFFSSAGPFQTLGRGARKIAGPLLVGGALAVAGGIGTGLAAGARTFGSDAGPFQTIARGLGMLKGPVGRFNARLGTATFQLQQARFSGGQPDTAQRARIGGTLHKVGPMGIAPSGATTNASLDISASPAVIRAMRSVGGGGGGGGISGTSCDCSRSRASMSAACIEKCFG